MVKMKWTKKLFALVLSIAMTALVLTASISSAISIPPVVQITASPTSANTTSTITAVAMGLGGAGISWVKIYENDILNKTCSTSTCVYVAAHVASGTYSYYAKTHDTNGREATSNTVHVTFEGINQAPVARNDSYAVNEDTLLSIPALGVLANDTDVDGDSLTAHLVIDVAHGTLTLNADGSFTYMPAANYNGLDSFTYVANDGALNSTPATVTITVNPVNDAPIAANDNYATAEDTPLSIPSLGVLINDTDVDGDSLTAILVTNVSHGTLSLNSDGSFDYIPAADYNGLDSFTYVANDGTVDSNIATVSITVTPVNDAPVWATPIPDQTLDEDFGNFVAVPDLSALATDVDGDPLTFTIVDENTSQVDCSITGGTQLELNSVLNWNGLASCIVQVSDGTASANDTFTITVNPINDAPVAVDDSYTVAEDGTLSIAALGVLANDSDVDGDNLTAILVTDVSNGILSLNSDGSFTYTPNALFHDVDTFTYVANDGTNNSNIATVTITVTHTNHAPVAVNDNYVTDEDTLLSIPSLGVLENDSDVDGDSLIANLVTDVAHGILTLNADGSFDYAPAANYFGIDSFTYVANDGALNSTPATVTITVNSVNDIPVAVNDSYATDEDTPLSIPSLGVLANDSDVDGDSLTANLVTDVSNGILSLNSDGSFTYTPGANFNGVDSFTYVANDGLADSNIATVTITVNSVNDIPVAVNDSYATDEDTLLSIDALSGVLANDTDTEGSPLTANLVTDVSNGALSLNSDGSFTYTPGANFNGVDSFTYVANDGTDNSTIATVTIAVNPVNDAPVAQNDAYTVAEDGTLSIAALGVLANDTDTEGSPLTAHLATDVSNGALILNIDGSFDYTPDALFYGIDTFTYVANDGTDNSTVATVTITVTHTNHAPVAVNDNYVTDEDTLLSIPSLGILINDSDVDGDSLTARNISSPSHGTLTLNADSSFTYMPSANFNGADSFTYVANDGTVDSNIATVSITVTPVNDIPVAVNDSYATDEDTLLSIDALSGVLANDSDVEDAITSILVADVSHGALTLNANGSFDYTPAANYFGLDSFTYVANDGTANSSIATVSITVNPVNDAPILDAIGNFTINESQLLQFTIHGSDPDNDTLTYSAIGLPDGATLDPNTGDFSWTPNFTQAGSYDINFSVSDGSLSDSEVITITVNNVNRAPVATNDNYITAEDTPLSIPSLGILANDTDADGDSLTAALVTDVTNGTLTLNANGSFNYTPDANFNGADTFTYVTNDGALNSTPATVTITVNPVNDAPVATNDNYVTAEDTPLSITAPGILANDTDADGDSLTAHLVTDVSHGTLTLNTDGSFTYTPAANYFGPDSFTYVANDGALNSTSATVTITVNAVNDAPVAENDSYTVAEDGTLSIPALGVLANDTDVENDTLNAMLVSNVSNGTLSLNSDGSFDYTPDANFNGIDSFTYHANDGTANSTAATVTINVTAVNDAPVALNDNYVTAEDTLLNIPSLGIFANDTDIEGDSLNAVLLSDVSNGTLILNVNDGSFNYTPDADFNGVDSFVYYVNDGANNSNVATVAITVNPVNDAPVATITNPANNSNFTFGTQINFTGTGSDIEDGALDNNSLVWTSSIDGNFGNGTEVDTSALSVGTHVITLNAIDSDGLSSTATITLTIAPVAPVLSVDIWAVPASQIEDLNQNATYVVYVNNTGSGTNTFNLSFTNPDNADILYFVGNSQLTLNSGETGTVNLTISDSNPGIFNVNVTATDEDNSGVSDTFLIRANFTTTDTGWIYNSTVNGIFYISQSTGIFDNINDAIIRDSTINSENSSEFATEVWIVNSNITNHSIITDLASTSYDGPDVYIVGCNIINSTKIDAYCENSHIENSIDPRSNTTGSFINNSEYYNSNITYSTVNYSYINNSNIDGSVLEGSRLINSIVDNSTISGTTLENVNVSNSVLTDVNITLKDLVIENATIINGTAYNGTFSYRGSLPVIVSNDTALFYLVNFGPTADLHMPGDGFVGEAVGLDASGSSDPNIENGINIAWTFNDTLKYTFEISGDGYHDIVVESNESYHDGAYDGIYNYAFPAAGSYTVIVNVTDALGENSASSPRTINVAVRPYSGGGGGGTIKCTTNWTCGAWSDCINGTQTRNCTKIASICNAGDMPLLKMTCTVPNITIPTNITEGNVTGNGTGTGIISRITGGTIGALNSRMIGALIFIIIMLIAGGILWLARKNRSKANKVRKSRRK
jgi:VCBS repeat-containing protein